MTKDTSYFIATAIAVFVVIGIVFTIAFKKSKEDRRLCAEAGNQVLEVYDGSWVCFPASKAN